MAKHKPKTDPNTMIAVALGIDEGDLEANNVGQIGRNQHRPLQQQRRNGLIWSAFSICLLGCAVVLLINLPEIEEQTLTWFGFCCALYGFFYFAVHVFHAWRDLHHNRIEFVEGRVNQTVSIIGKNYKIRVGKRSFAVNQATFLAFKNGDPYCIYYAPRTKTLLGAEWLAEDNPFWDASDISVEAKDEEIVDTSLYSEEKHQRGTMG